MKNRFLISLALISPAVLATVFYLGLSQTESFQLTQKIGRAADAFVHPDRYSSEECDRLLREGDAARIQLEQTYQASDRLTHPGEPVPQQFPAFLATSPPIGDEPPSIPRAD